MPLLEEAPILFLVCVITHVVTDWILDRVWPEKGE